MNSSIFYVFFAFICFVSLIVGIVIRICLDKELKQKIVEHNENLVFKYNDNECVISNIWIKPSEFLKSTDINISSCNSEDIFTLIDYRGRYDLIDICKSKL